MKKSKLFLSIVFAVVMALACVSFVACRAQKPNVDNSTDSITSVGKTDITVVFDSNGGSEVNSVTVESGSTITRPTDPEKTGYTFAGWYIGETEYDFAAAADADMTLTASWTANTDTAYTVKHYLQNLADDDYTEATDDAEALTGTTDAMTAATAKAYVGFTAKAFEQATIAADGSTTVSIYYDRNMLEVTFSADGTENTESVRYGAKATKPSDPEKDGYKFVGWYLGDAEYDFDAEVYEGFTLTAVFETPYTVKHYLQNLDDDDYTEDPSDADNMTGMAGELTAAAAKTYDGFTAKAFDQAAIAEDGSTTVSIYYDRNVYEITWSVDGNETTGSYKYGYEPTAPAVANKAVNGLAYDFKGWDKAVTTVTEDRTYTADFAYTVNKITYNTDNGKYECAETESQNAYAKLAGTVDAENGFEVSALITTYYTYWPKVGLGFEDENGQMLFVLGMRNRMCTRAGSDVNDYASFQSEPVLTDDTGTRSFFEQNSDSQNVGVLSGTLRVKYLNGTFYVFRGDLMLYSFGMNDAGRNTSMSTTGTYNVYLVAFQVAENENGRGDYASYPYFTWENVDISDDAMSGIRFTLNYSDPGACVQEIKLSGGELSSLPIALSYGVKIKDSDSGTIITEAYLKSLTESKTINVAYVKEGLYPNAINYNALYDRIQWAGDMNGYTRIALADTVTGDFEMTLDVERNKANADTGIAVNLRDSSGNDLQLIVGPNYIAAQKEWARQNGSGWVAGNVISLNGVNGWTTNLGTQNDTLWSYALTIRVVNGVATMFINGYECGSFRLTTVYPGFNASGAMSLWLATKDTDFGGGGYLYFKNINVDDDYTPPGYKITLVYPDPAGFTETLYLDNGNLSALPIALQFGVRINDSATNTKITEEYLKSFTVDTTINVTYSKSGPYPNALYYNAAYDRIQWAGDMNNYERIALNDTVTGDFEITLNVERNKANPDTGIAINLTDSSGNDLQLIVGPNYIAAQKEWARQNADNGWVTDNVISLNGVNGWTTNLGTQDGNLWSYALTIRVANGVATMFINGYECGSFRLTAVYPDFNAGGRMSLWLAVKDTDFGGGGYLYFKNINVDDDYTPPGYKITLVYPDPNGISEVIYLDGDTLSALPIALRYGVRIKDSEGTRITEEYLKALTGDTTINVTYQKAGKYPNALNYNPTYDRIQWAGDMDGYTRILLDDTVTGDFEMTFDVERNKANADTGIAVNLTDSSGNDLQLIVGPNYIAAQKEWARQTADNGWVAGNVISLNGVNGWTTNLGTQNDTLWSYTLKIRVVDGVATIYIDGYNCGCFTLTSVYPGFNASGTMYLWLATKDTDFGGGGYLYFKNLEVNDDYIPAGYRITLNYPDPAGFTEVIYLDNGNLSALPIALQFGVRINDSATNTKITEAYLKALTEDTTINVAYSKSGPYPNALYYNAANERIQWAGDMNNYERIALNDTVTGDFEITLNVERYKANADTGIAINLTDSNGNDLELIVGPNYIAAQKEWARQNGSGWVTDNVISLNGVNGWTTNVGTQTDGVWKYTLKISVSGGVATVYIDDYNCGSFTLSTVYSGFNTSGNISFWLAVKDTDFGSGGYLYFKNISVTDN